MNFEFTWLFIIRILSGVFALALVLALWKRRRTDGVNFMIFFEFAASLWAISEGFEHAATDFQVKLLWSQIGYIGASTTTLFFLFFTLAYTQSTKFTKPFAIGIFLFIPLVTVLLVFTNSYHHLIWERVDFFPLNNENVYYYGSWFWIYALYEYLILIIAIIVLLVGTFRFYKIYKIQLIYLIIASVMPLVTSIMYVYKLIPLNADLTPIVLIFSGILSAIGIYFQRMFDVVPVARRQTINNLSDGVIVIDMVDRIVDVNLAFGRIINADRDLLIGNQFKRFSHLFLTDRPELSSESEFLTETTIRTNGGVRYFEVKYSPVTNNKNQLIGRIFLLHDISIRKKALDAAFESNALLRNEIAEKEKLITDLDAYARTVAHDLKNPISGVIGLTDFIKEDIQNQEEGKAFKLLDLLNEQGYKMLKIVDELLMLSRIRKEDFNPVEVDMYLIVNEAIKRLNLLAEERNATIVLPEKWPVVFGHSQWIEEVWVNLLSNAIKYGGDPPKIVMGSEDLKDGRFRFWIQDNGKGLPSESFEKLFTDFERLGKNNVEGHGLGLSITKRIIEKLGGQVFVSSENSPGKGCIFSFILKG